MFLCHSSLSLQELKECFETKNIPKLQEVLAKLSKEEASYHMKRCVDSGLWVSDAKAAGKNAHLLSLYTS